MEGFHAVNRPDRRSYPDELTRWGFRENRKSVADRGIMFERLSTKFPDCDPKPLEALAAVWTREAGLVVSRMFEIYGETEVMRLPIEVRHEAKFELARSLLALGAVHLAWENRTEAATILTKARAMLQECELEQEESIAQDLLAKLRLP